MRLRAAHWNFVLLAGLQVRRACAAADESRARRAQTSVKSLRATQTKFNYRVILGREADARRLCRDETLKV